MTEFSQDAPRRRGPAKALALIPFAIAVPGELVSQTMLDNVIDAYRGELDVEMSVGLQDTPMPRQDITTPSMNQGMNDQVPGMLEPAQYWRSLSDPSQITTQPVGADEGLAFGSAYQPVDLDILDQLDLSNTAQSVIGASDQSQFTPGTTSRSIASNAQVEAMSPPAGAANFPTNRSDVRTWAESYSDHVLSTVNQVADSVLPPENTEEIQARLSALLNRIVGP
ncbi:hypothetical protein [Roseicyclus sp.]